jgi:hypothetical protein
MGEAGYSNGVLQKGGFLQPFCWLYSPSSDGEAPPYKLALKDGTEVVVDVRVVNGSPKCKPLVDEIAQLENAKMEAERTLDMLARTKNLSDPVVRELENTRNESVLKNSVCAPARLLGAKEATVCVCAARQWNAWMSTKWTSAIADGSSKPALA